jgi:hypothetical protein
VPPLPHHRAYGSVPRRFVDFFRRTRACALETKKTQRNSALLPSDDDFRDRRVRIRLVVLDPSETRGSGIKAGAEGGCTPAIVAATSLEEGDPGVSEEPAFLG